MAEAFEIRRRTGLYALIGLWCLLLAGGFGWFAYDDRSIGFAVASGVLALFALVHLWGVRDPRTPLFVADDHGVRMRHGRDWVGLLWSEMGELRVESRDGVRHDARVKVIPRDGRAIYTAPLGLVTTVSPDEARDQLARRRAAAAY